VKDDQQSWSTYFLAGAFVSFIATSALHLYVYQPEAKRKAAEATAECIEKNEIPHNPYEGCVNKGVDSGYYGGATNGE
jgi:hypothetical protein